MPALWTQRENIYVFLYIAKKNRLRQESLQKLQIRGLGESCPILFSSFLTTIATRSWNSAGLKISAERGQLCAINILILQAHSLWKRYSSMSKAVNFKSSKFHKQQPMKNHGNLGACDSWNKGLAIHVMLSASNHGQQMYFDTKSSFFTFRCINWVRASSHIPIFHHP